MPHKRSAPPLREVTSAQVAEHAGLARHVINRLFRTGQLSRDLEREDVESVAMWAIWEALRRYDGTKGTKVSTYLSSYVWGYVMHYQRSVTQATGWHRTKGRLAYVSSYEAAVDALQIPDQPADDDTEQEALWSVTHEHLTAVVDQLPPQQKVTGLAVLHDTPTAPVARELGVGRMTAHNHRDRALAAMAAAIQ